MTTRELRIKVTGIERDVERYVHELKKTASEGERYGVTISVQRIETEPADLDELGGFE